MWTPRFPFGLEGTEQTILGRNYLPKREQTSPRGEQTTAQSKCKHETEQNICCIPRGGIRRGRSPRGAPLSRRCSSHTRCAVYASCAAECN